MQSKLRFGVLGVGRIGKIHIANLVNRIPGVEVVALSDVAGAVLEAVASAFGIARTFHDYRDLLDLPEVDAVVICSPTNLHYQMIVDAAARGKAIFCEKPIDLSLEKVQAANDEVKRRGVPMMVGFNRRFDPNFLRVREVIAAGKVGQPHMLRITSRDPGPPPEAYIRASGGIFLDMTIHDFDMARYLMGSEVTEVYTRAACAGGPGVCQGRRLGYRAGHPDLRKRRVRQHRQAVRPPYRSRLASASRSGDGVLDLSGQAGFGAEGRAGRARPG